MTKVRDVMTANLSSLDTSASVLDGDRPVGILSIGDLAMDRDRQSALGGISAAQPNQ